MGRSWLMRFKTNRKHVYKCFIDEDLQRLTTPKSDRAWDNIEKTQRSRLWLSRHGPHRVDLFWTTEKRAQIHLNNNHRTDNCFFHSVSMIFAKSKTTLIMSETDLYMWFIQNRVWYNWTIAIPFILRDVHFLIWDQHFSDDSVVP